MIWLCVNDSNLKPIYICSYYIPETADGTKCMEQLREALCRIYTKHKRSPPLIIIAGDMNLGDIDWTNLRPTNAHTATHHHRLLDLCAEFCLQNMQQEVSRPESGKCLDLVITNKPTTIDNCTTIPGMSDHNAVRFNVNTKPQRAEKPPHKVYQYNKCDIEGLKNELTKITVEFFSSNPAARSVNENWTLFRSKVLEAMDKFIPSKMSRSRRNLPWITKTIKRLMRKRDRLFSKARKSKKEKDWGAYRRFRNHLAKTIKLSYHDYINNVIGDALTENPKHFWSFVKTSRMENMGIPTLVDDSNIHVSDSAKAEALNSHFQAQFTQERGDIPEMPESPYPSLENLTVGLEGVVRQLKNVNPNKATGPDELPARIFHDYAEELAPMLRFIYQQFYDMGTIPDDWKHATVSAIHKKGPTSSAANYRPISLTCIACKIMEHICLSHINKHLERHSIIKGIQHGFRACFSCTTQLIESVHDWALSLNEKRGNRVCQVDTILLDFSKAFDRVAHNRLLAKLQYYGIRGNMKLWIQSFLAGRTQKVSVNGVHSNPINVTSGVPQGSVLDPALFLLFINDIADDVKPDTGIRLFADDSILYRPIWNEADHHILQQDLSHLLSWANKWQMDFNTSKCKVLTISLKKHPVHYAYCMGNDFLEHVPSHGYLGVTISSNLHWSEHCQDIASKATRTLNVVRRTLHPCTKEVKERAYQTLVRPKLEYASAAWNPYTATDIKRIEQVQRNAARFVCNEYTRTAQVTNLVNSLGWQTLETRRRLALLTNLHNIIHNRVGINLPSYITPAPRDPLKFMQPSTRVNIYQYSFYPRAVRLWNKLPEDVRTVDTKLGFASLASPLVGDMSTPAQLLCL